MERKSLLHSGHINPCFSSWENEYQWRGSLSYTLDILTPAFPPEKMSINGEEVSLTLWTYKPLLFLLRKWVSMERKSLLHSGHINPCFSSWENEYQWRGSLSYTLDILTPAFPPEKMSINGEEVYLTLPTYKPVFLLRKWVSMERKSLLHSEHINPCFSSWENEYQWKGSLSYTPDI